MVLERDWRSRVPYGASRFAIEPFVETRSRKPTTVEFTSFGFNNRLYAVPPGLRSYEITIDLRPDGIDLLVPVKLVG